MRGHSKTSKRAGSRPRRNRVRSKARSESKERIRAREAVRRQFQATALSARIANLESRVCSLTAERNRYAKRFEDVSQIQTELESRVRERTAELTATVSDLEAFSYSISHDLRAPLRAMEGYAQILQHKLRGALDPVSQDFLNRISSSAKRLDSLIQDVLKYSRVARAPLEIARVNVEHLVEEIIRDYPNLQPAEAEIEIRKPLHPVRANEAFLTQCISNLLSNGVKFVKPGHRPHVLVWTQELKRAVRLCFEDNGIGVAPENQRRIFGIFQRMHSPVDYEGTGIGLAIVKKAAERMGGSVGLESVLGKGSRFWIELPTA